MTALDPAASAPLPHVGAAPGAAAGAASGTADRLFHALRGLSVLATVIGVGGHDCEAISGFMPEAGGVTERLAAVPSAAWLFCAVHVAAAVASLALGYLIISLAYPLRSLAQRAHGNPAAAIQASAHLLGAAVISTVSWGGSGAPSLLVSPVFCGLGWAAVIVICAGHRLVTRYRDHEEIAAGNAAAALAAAGLHLAVAIVVAHAIQGQFAGWSQALSGFAAALVWVLGLYPLRQLVLTRLILGVTPREMDAAISVRRDPYLAAAEAIFYIVTAVCLSAGW